MIMRFQSNTIQIIIINQLNNFNKHINLGDLIALLGTIDSVLGGIDLPECANLFIIINISYIITTSNNLYYYL